MSMQQSDCSVGHMSQCIYCTNWAIRYTLSLFHLSKSMAYHTDFTGQLVVHPSLPQDVVDTYNIIASGRNNLHGDAVPYSFDAIVHHLYGLPPGISKKTAMTYGQMLRMTKTPSLWSGWRLYNLTSDDQDTTTILCWSEMEEFYEYMYWLQYAIDFITLLAKHMHDIDIHNFDGAITWAGKDVK